MRAETPHRSERYAGDRRRYWCHENEAVISDNLKHMDELGRQRKLIKSHHPYSSFPSGRERCEGRAEPGGALAVHRLPYAEL